MVDPVVDVVAAERLEPLGCLAVGGQDRLVVALAAGQRRLETAHLGRQLVEPLAERARRLTQPAVDGLPRRAHAEPAVPSAGTVAPSVGTVTPSIGGA